MQVDAGHIYGDNLQRQHQLRLLKDGKLKFQVKNYRFLLRVFFPIRDKSHDRWRVLSSQQIVNGGMYPPTVDEVPIRMNYPPWIPTQNKIAIGHEVFGLLPGLGMYATLWLREHNRVCDVLKAEHPTWDDEQLFQTARLIIIGESEQDTHRH